jgi:hypothetical protein
MFGEAFLTETVFEKKISGAGEDSAVGASASAVSVLGFWA